MISIEIPEKLTETDFAAIKLLLLEAKLPIDDLHAEKVEFIVARSEGSIVACLGLERKDKNALLRSFAVKSEYRNHGLGTTLMTELLQSKQVSTVQKLHLLTNTAEEYFKKQGFEVKSRDLAPLEISDTEEFSAICPASAVYMVKQLR